MSLRLAGCQTTFFFFFLSQANVTVSLYVTVVKMCLSLATILKNITVLGKWDVSLIIF